jgi:putative CocE/NonD family hydrolase
MTGDQRFAASRPDVLVYETEPLNEKITFVGPLKAELHVSTTGTDADWVVKLIDVYPDDAADPDPNPSGVSMGGYQQLVRAEVMRGKFRKSLEQPEPFVTGEPTEVTFTLPDVYHTFLPGHKLMVQIQSSWFPLVDRNPQKFVDIFQARDSDFQSATQRVYRSGQRASRLIAERLP